MRRSSAIRGEKNRVVFGHFLAIARNPRIAPRTSCRRRTLRPRHSVWTLPRAPRIDPHCRREARARFACPRRLPRRWPCHKTRRRAPTLRQGASRLRRQRPCTTMHTRTASRRFPRRKYLGRRRPFHGQVLRTGKCPRRAAPPAHHTATPFSTDARVTSWRRLALRIGP